MTQYKVSPGPRGRKLYFKENEKGKFKMISVKNIPEDILESLETSQPLDDQKPEFRKCIFCGEPATEEKLVNREIVYLCLADYQDRTTGEVVENLRLSVANPV